MYIAPEVIVIGAIVVLLGVLFVVNWLFCDGHLWCAIKHTFLWPWAMWEDWRESRRK